MAFAITNTSCIRPSPNVQFTSIEGEVVLMDRRKGIYFGLDEIGSLIWQSLVQDLSFEEMLSSIQSRYDVDRPALVTDVTHLLSTLQEKGLVEVS